MGEVKKVVFDGLSFIVLVLAITIIFCNGLVLYKTEGPITGRAKSFPFITASLVSMNIAYESLILSNYG